jgi:hypothetical protein
MKRRNFIGKSIITTAAVAGGGFTSAMAQRSPKKNELYEFRVYHMRRNMAPLDDYFSKALIPALNRMNVKTVGVFRETGKSEPAKIYLLIPYSSFDHFAKVALDLKTDRDFAQASSEYNKIPVEQAVYERYDSSLLVAFDGLPQMIVPSTHAARLFELRIYEGYSEDAVRRKVKMFNEGEIDIFKNVKINPVFFGENVSGKDLPGLTYMAVYDNMEERDKAWKGFLDHPDWKKMSKMPEYANTVSRIHKIFLEPVPYSQV